MHFSGRKSFICPPIEPSLPEGCTANFQDIMDLYNYEATMPLKKAHRLSAAALDPKNIEKVSVKLATSVFSESTRDALTFYATHENKSTWGGTADFITLILKLWNVMNVKSRTKGKHKRDYTMDPVSSPHDWKLDFLGEFADFLQRWESSKQPGLTRETFLALRHTCLALRDCARYLLNECGFNYVLFGYLQSDDLESRFGWLRQLSGANYFISMRQIVECDRKIRAVSLLKFDGFSLAEIDEAVQSSSQDERQSTDDERTADTVAELITLNSWPTASDANVIYYVSGAIARSVIRITKCNNCKDLLVSSDKTMEPLQLEGTSNYKASSFFDNINRGGLCRPSDYCFLVAVQCWRVYEYIKLSTILKGKLLGAANQRHLFVKIMERATENGQLLVQGNFCAKGHDVKELVTIRFFNCVAKNLAKEITAAASSLNVQSAKKRKIAKLSGNSKAN